MAVTTRRQRSAQKRRNWHERQIADAADWRQRIWRAAGWIVAEARRLADSDRNHLIGRLVAVAYELNERNGAGANDE